MDAPSARATKIVATLGPASSSADTLARMIRAGVDVVRLNFSHGTAEDHAARAALVRAAAAACDREVAIMADLQGPKIRVGKFADGKVLLEPGRPFVLDAACELGDEGKVGLDYPDLPRDVRAGDILLLNDGLIRLLVIRVAGTEIHTEVLVGGELSNNKGINRQGGGLTAPALTGKDMEDLRSAVQMGVDYVAISFPKNRTDMEMARQLVAIAGAPTGARPQLIAKIERAEAIAVLEEIIDASDGIMVARGDLAVEVGAAAVPALQKRMIRMARSRNRTVITATQMMESMIVNAMPTRAEVSDVANAVYDGADAVMLSAETAAGQWPEEAVTMMDRIAAKIEADASYRTRIRMHDTRPDPTTADALSHACMTIAETMPISAVVVFTGSGSTARRVSRERPSVPVMVLTPSLKTARRMALLWGTHAVATRDIGSFEEMVAKGKRMALRHGMGEAGSRLVMLAGVPFGTPGSTNLLHVVRLTGDELERHGE